MPECPVNQAQARDPSGPNTHQQASTSVGRTFPSSLHQSTLLSRLYTDDMSRFPVKPRSGNQYVMIAFPADGNLILQQVFKTRNDRHWIAAYNTIML